MKRLAQIGLPIATLVATSCGGGHVTVSTDASYFQPSSIVEVAHASSLRVEATVESAGELSQIPAEQAASPDPITGERQDAAPQLFAYEIARIKVLRVFGPGMTGVAVGDVLTVGVPVLDPAANASPGEDLAAMATRPGQTFQGGAGQTGVFFLTATRQLGTYGPGREVMGFAQFSDANSAIVRAVFGGFRGRLVARSDVTHAASAG